MGQVLRRIHLGEFIEETRGAVHRDQQVERAQAGVAARACRNSQNVTAAVEAAVRAKSR